VAVALGVLLALGVALTLLLGGSRAAHSRTGGDGNGSLASSTHRPAHASSYAVGLTVLHLVDSRRTIELPNGTREPRPLVTAVRYPARGAASETDVPGAAPARADGPFPLVVFGHGFDVTPNLYKQLLQSWAHAGFVVAAPTFPLENANAPGGPNESDLINQPGDMRFVISSILNASGAASGPLSGLVNPSAVAVAGQSDGGDTALAVGYDRYVHDPRVKAVVVLSGAEMPGLGGFEFGGGGPPLLATQGTADTVNLPGETQQFFEAARPPKFLLSLLGAAHLPPYSYEQPQLSIVQRTTSAFLAAYLEHRPGALQRLVAAGRVPGTAAMLARP
jgi:dienelactone hydrolase